MMRIIFIEKNTLNVNNIWESLNSYYETNKKIILFKPGSKTANHLYHMTGASGKFARDSISVNKDLNRISIIFSLCDI